METGMYTTLPPKKEILAKFPTTVESPLHQQMQNLRLSAM